jgi:hypothetical protein
VCDACNADIAIDTGYLTGPLLHDDASPSLLCESCWDKYVKRPWDGDVSRMTPSDAQAWQPVVDELQSLGDSQSTLSPLTAVPPTAPDAAPPGTPEPAVRPPAEQRDTAGNDASDTAAAQSSINKLEAATILAAIARLGAGTQAELVQIQDMMSKSAAMLEQRAQMGADVQWLGLALREFCDAAERIPHTPINRPLLQRIREQCDHNLPAQIDPVIEREFRAAVAQYASPIPSPKPRAGSPQVSTASRLDGLTVARNAAQEFWNSADMESDRHAQRHACDCCQTPIPVGAGCAVQPRSALPIEIDLSAFEQRTSPERLAQRSRAIAGLAAEYKQFAAEPTFNSESLEERARELLSESPHDTRLLLALGVMRFRRHRFDEAQEAFSNAARLAPADSVLQYHLGRVHEELGQPARALRDYDRARRFSFNATAARTAYYRLETKLHPVKRPKSAPLLNVAGNKVESPADPALTAAEVGTMLNSREFDTLICYGQYAVQGLVSAICQPTNHTHPPLAAAVLSRIGSPSVAALVDALYANPATLEARHLVVGALALIASPAAVLALRQSMKELLTQKAYQNQQNPPLRYVLAGLIQTGDARALATIRKLLLHDDARLREITLDAFRSSKALLFDSGCSFESPLLVDSGTADILLERCRDNTHPQESFDARDALSLFNSPAAPRACAELMIRSSSSERQRAAARLWILAQQHVPFALTGHSIPSTGRRGDVWDVSGWLGNDGAIAKLVSVLDSGVDNHDLHTQKYAGWALGLLGDLALPALVAASRQATHGMRVGLGWVSQTMHEAGRRILADCDIRLSLSQPNPDRLKLDTPSECVFPGDVKVALPQLENAAFLVTDTAGHVRLCPRPWLLNRVTTIWGTDRDDFPNGAEFVAQAFDDPGAMNSVKPRSLAISAEVKKLNDALPNVWKAVKFSTTACGCCGIEMPTAEDADFMNLGFIGVVQRNPQAISTALQVTAAYYQNPEELQKVTESMEANHILLARSAVFAFAKLHQCERCQSWTCKRCDKLPHDPGGCVICSLERRRAEELPWLVCEDCFARRRFTAWNS